MTVRLVTITFAAVMLALFAAWLIFLVRLVIAL